jgi:hypothetical protein
VIRPLLVWAVAAAGILVLAAAFGYSPFRGATWSRYDSTHYASIARGGYDLDRCPLDYEPDPGGWCGNAGWFPLYPWLAGGLHRLGVPLRGGAVGLSFAFTAATLVLLWRTFLRRRRDAVVLAALVYAAWAPGQIYDYSLFPLSLLAFCTVAQFWLLTERRYVAAGIAGAGAVLAYPLGVVVIPVAAAWALWHRRVREAIVTAGIAALGLMVLAVDQQVETGHWNAYLLVQRKYHHHLQNPLAATYDQLRPLVHGSPFDQLDATAWQTLLVTTVIAAVTVQAVRRRSDGLLVLWALVTWLVPLSQAAVEIQRSQAALLPVAVLLPRLPRRLAFVFAIAAVPIAVALEKLFLDGRIV